MPQLNRTIATRANRFIRKLPEFGRRIPQRADTTRTTISGRRIQIMIVSRDGRLLFATRFVRLFAYGSLSVVLVFYLVGVSMSETQTGTLLTLTLVGDTAVSLFLTTSADRIGRRRMLVAGALLMAGAGLVFAATSQFWI